MLGGIARLLLRLLLLAAGLVFAASLVVAFLLLLLLWSLRAGWALLTGRPVSAFVFRMRAREGFEWMHRKAAAADTRTPRADATRPGARGSPQGDVLDVEPRMVAPPAADAQPGGSGEPGDPGKR